MNEERQMVRDFFEDYNRNIANRQNLEFKVIDWEHYSNSGVGRTQALITKQTLDDFRNSLVLVIGLLGQRFGTPTDIIESGTEEEFETAIRFRQEQGDWPEIKWFFREKWGKQGPPKNPNETDGSKRTMARKYWISKSQVAKQRASTCTRKISTRPRFP